MTIDARQPQATTAVSHGQAATLEAIYRAHAGGLRGRLTAQTRDPALADDLVSEAFLRLAIEIREGRSPREPRAWLYRVGSNLLVSRARRATVATRAMPGLLERDVMGSPEDEVIAREGHGLVRDGLATLGRTDREIVVLAALGMSNREMASMLGCSAEATRTRLCRARGRLRVRLELAGMTV